MRKVSHIDSCVVDLAGRLCVAVTDQESQLQINQSQQANANFKFVCLFICDA